MLRDLPSTPGQPCITRFVINRVTMNVNYTIEGYGQLVKGLAAPGTTPLRLMLQFLADYAPPDLEVVPECLAGLQAHCEVAVEWETDSGAVFENGAISVFPTEGNGDPQAQDRETARSSQRARLELLKKRIRYGKYALTGDPVS